MNPKEFAALFAKTIHAMKSGKPIDPQLQKSLDEEMANEFDRFIPDWEQPGEINKVPTAQTIIFGPTEASSGAGAARMVEQYSSFADQGGITALYAEFSRRMAPMRADMDAGKAEMATIKNSVFSLVKASEDAAAAATPVVAKADDDDEDEKTRMVEKARKTMRKARVLIVKAEDAEGGDSEEDGEEDEISEDMEKAARLLKGVKDDLTKAEEARKDDEDEDEEIEKARTMRKALVKRLSAVKKARAPVVVKTKEEEEAEEEAKKAAEAAKAKDNDKGNQEAAQNPANGNQEDAAAKSSEVSLLTKSVSELMDFLMTSASGGRINPAPVFQKAQQDKVASIAMAIDEAADNREISDSEAIDAQGIVARLEMIKSGQVDRKSVLDMLAKSSPKVQALFSRVA